MPWKYRKVLPGHALRDIIGHYSGPGLARPLEEAEKLTREGAAIVRAARSFATQKNTAARRLP